MINYHLIKILFDLLSKICYFFDSKIKVNFFFNYAFITGEFLMLDPQDFVGVSFWLLSAAMVAATFFFWVERDRAVGKWKTSLTVAAMVTGIAAIHYFYMRGIWIDTGASPTVFRYVDWLLTVPLQIVEFYLILAAIAVVAVSVFWRLLALHQ